jgi:hypothetical protein
MRPSVQRQDVGVSVTAGFPHVLVQHVTAVGGNSAPADALYAVFSGHAENATGPPAEPGRMLPQVALPEVERLRRAALRHQ